MTYEVIILFEQLNWWLRHKSNFEQDSELTSCQKSSETKQHWCYDATSSNSSSSSYCLLSCHWLNLWLYWTFLGNKLQHLPLMPPPMLFVLIAILCLQCHQCKMLTHLVQQYQRIAITFPTTLKVSSFWILVMVFCYLYIIKPFYWYLNSLFVNGCYSR